jgi:hypothetical protein
MPFTGDSVPQIIWERDAWRSCADIFARSRRDPGGARVYVLVLPEEDD